MTQPSAPQVRAAVAGAARTITPTWPLTSFIAVNPASGHLRRPMQALHTVPGETPTRPEHEYLQGDVDLGVLRTAVAEVLPALTTADDLELAGRRSTALDVAVAALLHPPVDAASASDPERDDALDPVDQYLSQSLARFSADPVWAPAPGTGLFDRFRQLAGHDRTVPKRARTTLLALPTTAEAAIAEVLRANGIGAASRAAVVGAQLHALPGWASHLAWRAQHTGDATLTDLVACRLALTHALGAVVDVPAVDAAAPASDRVSVAAPDAGWVERTLRLCVGDTTHEPAPAERIAVSRVLRLLDPATRTTVWQTATETAYRDGLMATIARGGPADTVAPEARLDVQMVFCIDTRSEGLRRHLELTAGVRTFGLAGFFGVPLRYTSLFGQQPREQYPALLSTGYEVTDQAVDAAAARRARDRRALAGAVRSTTKRVASTPASAFGWAELSGWGTLVADLVRPVTGNRDGGRIPTPDTVLDVYEQIPLDDRVVAAEAALRMTGLTRFAPLVVLTGHRTETVNNPYRAALDCGACGGNPGGANARAAAAICNDPAVRRRLAQRGLSIPDTTWFVAAEHETTTDRLTVLDRHLVPDTHRETVDRLLAAAAVAGDALTAERARDLPGAGERTSLRRVRRRATDGSEMYPELGLANNAAIIIAPRAITRGVDLERRTFLHDYDPAADPDGSALTNIMTAPLIVAQWINAQYYFSTINPERHGAGNKTVHNPLGDLGVLAGHTGDLRAGLPWQSVAVGGRLLHEPLRLSVLIQAPLDRIAQIVAATDALRALLDGGWISLHARQDPHQPWQRYRAAGFTTDERNPS
ncbi:putative inorganic carbon transporter subunit DabA [Curtobacterium sp. UCD-KPL2560]|uniref:putative inorganic carbon transporter subunit DabA n=1 Tax=Curtobacterium sp. UCD-KPL2560 TaxID=1885315 RepID=UPI0008262F73|nr:putative inorganic carbon transporter subunit DabA [Curtobacterium sp. UCD-KPL2560]